VLQKCSWPCCGNENASANGSKFCHNEAFPGGVGFLESWIPAADDVLGVMDVDDLSDGLIKETAFIDTGEKRLDGLLGRIPWREHVGLVAVKVVISLDSKVVKKVVHELERGAGMTAFSCLEACQVVGVDRSQHLLQDDFRNKVVGDKLLDFSSMQVGNEVMGCS
jgi:hypothetical protein